MSARESVRTPTEVQAWLYSGSTLTVDPPIIFQFASMPLMSLRHWALILDSKRRRCLLGIQGALLAFTTVSSIGSSVYGCYECPDHCLLVFRESLGQKGDLNKVIFHVVEQLALRHHGHNKLDLYHFPRRGIQYRNHGLCT